MMAFLKRVFGTPVQVQKQFTEGLKGLDTAAKDLDGLLDEIRDYNTSLDQRVEVSKKAVRSARPPEQVAKLLEDPDAAVPGFRKPAPSHSG